MHGMVFAELQKYVTEKLGPEAWKKLIQEAKVGGKIYLTVQAYDDGEMVSLVAAASKVTGQPASAILEDFGQWVVKDLVKIYKTLIKPEWKTLDLIENTEKAIHTVVRTRNPGAAPPELRCVRTGPKEVVITYESRRKLCAFAVGLVKGIGKLYNENMKIVQTACMLQGAPACKISVQLN